MSIIVEGMDNTGKSTLCRALAERFYLPIINRQGRPDPVTLMQQINSFVLLDPPAIFDRHPLISERVYSEVLGRNDIFRKTLTWDFYLMRLWLDNPLIIYCRPPLDTILKFKCPQMAGVEANAKELVAEYDQLMEVLKERHRFAVIRYDYTVIQSLEPIFTSVYCYLNERGEL